MWKVWEKPVKYTYPKFSQHIFLCSWFMLHALFNDPDRGAQIYSAQSISDPPDRSAFNWGGTESEITLAHIWMAQGRALKSTVHNGFQTPPSILPLMEGGGSRMSIKEHAKICGMETGTQINGLKRFSDPPWCSAFNQRGRVQNCYFSLAGPLSYVALSYWSRSPIPIYHLTALVTHGCHLPLVPLAPECVSSHNCYQSPLSVPNPFHSWTTSYCDFYLQSPASMSPIRMFWPPSPATSPPSGPLSIYYRITYPLSCWPVSRIQSTLVLNKNTVIPLSFTIRPSRQKIYLLFLHCFPVAFIHNQSTPLT